MNACKPPFPADDPAACGCCEGGIALTPLPTANRPGLPALSYRVGTHSSFMATMQARLSSSRYQALANLTSRDGGDFAIALLDAWATVADVLTFYQERIANEGYLRTATERRSLVELSRLVGYKPRPGVAASTYLAYTLDDNAKEEVTIPAGARAQSVPGSGELPQTFETSQPLKARAAWNNLKPRLTRPQRQENIVPNDPNKEGMLCIKGIATNLKVGDPLLIAFGEADPKLYFIRKLDADNIKQLTCLTIVKADNKQKPFPIFRVDPTRVNKAIIDDLVKPYSVKYRNAQRMERAVAMQFGKDFTKQDLQAAGNNGGVRLMALAENPGRPELILDAGDASNAVLQAIYPELKDTGGVAARNANAPVPLQINVYALRLEASLFGHNAPLCPDQLNSETKVMSYKEWEINTTFIKKNDNQDNPSE